MEQHDRREHHLVRGSRRIAEKLLSGIPRSPRSGKRFFAWFHFLDPHDRYMPHDKASASRTGARACATSTTAEVTYCGPASIGKLLDFVHGTALGRAHGVHHHGAITVRRSASTTSTCTASSSGRTWCACRCSSSLPGATPHHIDNADAARSISRRRSSICSASRTTREPPGVDGGGPPGLEVPELYVRRHPRRDARRTRRRHRSAGSTSDSDRRRALDPRRTAKHCRRSSRSGRRTRTSRCSTSTADPGELSHPIVKRRDVLRHERAPEGATDEFEATVHDIPPTIVQGRLLEPRRMLKKDE